MELQTLMKLASDKHFALIGAVIKRDRRLLWAILILLFLSGSVCAQNDMRYFITRSGDKLMEGDKEYRFISVNIPNLHLVEDNMAFEATNEWRFPGRV